jgi:hypothetical protein
VGVTEGVGVSVAEVVNTNERETDEENDVVGVFETVTDIVEDVEIVTEMDDEAEGDLETVGESDKVTGETVMEGVSDTDKQGQSAVPAGQPRYSIAKHEPSLMCLQGPAESYVHWSQSQMREGVGEAEE